jgi:hypothetical protein
VSSTPFDPMLDAQIETTIKLASTDCIGRELHRRCQKSESLALQAKERARLSKDLVAVGVAAETAQQAAIWCARFAAAAVQLLGSGDYETSTRCHALSAAATQHAAYAEVRWRLLTRAATRGVQVNA